MLDREDQELLRGGVGHQARHVPHVPLPGRQEVLSFQHQVRPPSRDKDTQLFSPESELDSSLTPPMSSAGINIMQGCF